MRRRRLASPRRSCEVVAVSNQFHRTSSDSQRWQLWICLDGFERGRELETVAANAGFPITVTSDVAGFAAGVAAAEPVVAILSDAVDGWLRVVGDIRRNHRLVRVLLITELTDRAELVTALGAGVDGIGRPTDLPDALLASVIGVCEQGVALPRALTKELVNEVRAGRGHFVRTSRGTVRVTDREWQILQLMLQGMTTREMATEMFVAVGTVRSHVSALLGKLGVRSRADALSLLGHK